MSRPSLILKDTLLDAAETVAARDGVSRLTFDAVAAEAGVSKGGVLHYYTTKDELIEGMVVRTANRWRHHYRTAYENEPPGPGRMTRGLLKSCFTDAQTWTEALRRGFASVFAALAHNPALIEPMRDAYAEFYRYVREDGLPPGVAESVTTAMDGLWFYWVLRLRPVDQSALDEMRGALEVTLTQALKDLEKSSSKKPAKPKA